MGDRRTSLCVRLWDLVSTLGYPGACDERVPLSCNVRGNTLWQETGVLLRDMRN